MDKTVKRQLPSGLDGFAFRHEGRLVLVLSGSLTPARARVVRMLLRMQSGQFRVVLAKAKVRPALATAGLA